MGYVLHLGHNPADLGLPASRVSTATVGFNSNYDVNCIASPLVSYNGSFPFSITHTAPSGKLWLSFMWMCSNFNTSITSNTWVPKFLSFFDSAGRSLATVTHPSNASNLTATANGDTSVSGTGSVSVLSTGISVWFDVSLEVTSSHIKIEIYANGSLVDTATAANKNGKGSPIMTTFNNFRMSYNDATYYFAHIAILDGVSTINRRFARRTPAAVGTYAQMTGAVSALADADMASRVTSNTAGQRESFSLSGPTGVSGSSIGAVHVVQSAQRGLGAPSKSGGFLRIGGANYDATPETAQLDAPRQITSTWATNPVDGSVWTTATVPTEVGILSAT